jgi:outer membrane protein assembly factor BamB
MREDSRVRLRLAARGAAAAAAVYCLVLAALLLANAAQLRRADVVESDAVDRLVKRLEASPGDAGLREEIRAFDFVARRAYFDTRERLRLGSFLLMGGAAVLIASLRLLAWLDARIDLPDPAATPSERRRSGRRARISIAAMGFALCATAVVLSETVAARSTPPGAGSTRQAPASASRLGPDDWPAFRGPGGLGAGGSGAFPTSWDVPSGRGVLWRSPVPLPGFSSPIVLRDTVYLSGSDGQLREVYAFDAASGALRWRREVKDVPGSPEGTPPVTADTGHAASSLATDGERVFAVFSNGDLAAVSPAGEVAWTRSLGVSNNPYGLASSLLVSASTLYVQFDERGGGKLYALDTATGNSVWVVDRVGESAWSSPILVTSGGKPRLVLNGNPAVSCYDAATGRQLWRVECMFGDVAPSPAYADGVTYAAALSAPLTAIGLESGAILWQAAENVPDVSSPAASGGLLFGATSYNMVSCWDARTGAVRWSREFPEPFYASPVIVGGNVYLTDRSGITRVFAASAQYRETATCALGEPSDCTPAFSAGRVYLRGRSFLVCVGGGV